jgi:hypothetical protein
VNIRLLGEVSLGIFLEIMDACPIAENSTNLVTLLQNHDIETGHIKVICPGDASATRTEDLRSNPARVCGLY